MSYQIRDCDGGLGSCIEVTEVFRGPEYIEFITGHLEQDPEKFARYRYSFVDLTGVTEIIISNEEIKHIAEICRRAAKINPNPVVAYATTGDLVFGLTRMFEALAAETGWEMQVFRSRPEAILWLTQRVQEKFELEDLKFE